MIVKKESKNKNRIIEWFLNVLLVMGGLPLLSKRLSQCDGKYSKEHSCCLSVGSSAAALVLSL